MESVTEQVAQETTNGQKALAGIYRAKPAKGVASKGRSDKKSGSRTNVGTHAVPRGAC